MADWPRFVEIVRQRQRFLLTTHVRPDCDALGSELAMAAILQTLGKDVLIVNPHPVPPNLAFLDPHRTINTLGVEFQADQLGGFDVLMVLDTNAWAQLGAMGEVLRASDALKVVLDHHVSGDQLQAEVFKNTAAEATGRLVFEAAEKLGVKVTAEMATALFAAVATDTGWFRFSSTGAETYRLAGKLSDAGAVPHRIYEALYECETLGRLRLVGRVMARATTELSGRLIHTYVVRDDFDVTGALPSDTEDMVNMTLAVGETEAAVIFVEQLTGGFKISFRSRSELDCSRLAEKFGGGGHKKAAGAFLEGSLEEVEAQVLDAVRAAMA